MKYLDTRLKPDSKGGYCANNSTPLHHFAHDGLVTENRHAAIHFAALEAQYLPTSTS